MRDATHSADQDGAGEPPEVARLRERLAEALRAQGLLDDPAVARAVRTVPRHRFLPGVPPDQAYADVAIPTHWAEGMAISSASQPAIVAFMLRQLDARPGMRVLEIGAGTGYNAALVAELVGAGGSVTTVDLDAEIASEARAHLDAAGYGRVRVVVGDGREGWPDDAPYDRMELTVGADDISPAWVEQLAPDGVLVLPLWLGAMDACIAFHRRGALLASESVAPCGFMRLRGREADAPQWLALPGRWRLALPQGAVPREALAAALARPPRRRIHSYGWSPAFFHYLTLRGLPVVTLWPATERKARALARPRYGVYAEGSDGPSLALLSARLPVMLSFGGMAAERLLEDELRAWPAVRLLPMERWQVVARPRTPMPALAASPAPGWIAVPRRHYVFEVRASE